MRFIAFLTLSTYLGRGGSLAMSALGDLKRRLRPGQVYRRKDLARWSNAVDRHVRALVAEGRLEKVSGGLYMAPRQTKFGAAPATAEKLVQSFLGDDQFLMVSPNAYNGLGVGTTQLYNEPVVYNRKRHGRFTLDGRVYDFRMRPSVPKRLTKELLLVDLMHNLDRLSEDRAAVLPRALARAGELDRARLARAVKDYGSARAERLLDPVLHPRTATA
ncbi:MAG: hypothetical protein ABI240_17270 [Sphingomonas sp.]